MKAEAPSAFILLTCLLVACASTKPAKDVQPSGFLGEYRPLLHQGVGGQEGLRVYRNPRTDWAAYDKIWLEPVMIWHDPAHPFPPDQQADLQHLADSFYDLLYVKLSKDYHMVEKAAPGAIRAQVAITHGEESRTGASFLSKVIPQARMANRLWNFGHGKPAFAGEVTIEWIAQDALSGELMGAGADRRVGGTNLFDKEVFNSWGDVKNSLEFWSDAAVYRLCVLRGGKDCVKPDP